VASLPPRSAGARLGRGREYFDRGPDLSDLVRRGAIYVDKILRGAKPGELPVEQASKFEFVLNMRTAKTLGLTIPPSIMIQVTEVIE